MKWNSFILDPPQVPLPALVCTEAGKILMAMWTGEKWASAIYGEEISDKITHWIFLESIPTPNEVDYTERATARRIDELENQIERLRNYDPCIDCSASEYLQIDHCSDCFSKVADKALMKLRSGKWLCPECAVKALDEKGVRL